MLVTTPKKVAEKPEDLGNKRSSQRCKTGSPAAAVAGFLHPSRVIISSQHLTAACEKDNRLPGSPFSEGKRHSGPLNLLHGRVRRGIRLSETGISSSPRANLPPIQICVNIHRSLVWSRVFLTWTQDKGTDKEAFPALHFILASSIWPLLHHYGSDILELN